MEPLIQSLIVCGLGVIELWVAIPAGFVLGLHPIAIGLAAIIGSMFGVLIVSMLGERIRTFLAQRYGIDGSGFKRYRRFYRIWIKYGVIGLGLLAPLFTGAPLGVAIGIALSIPKKRLLFWINIGILLWGAGLTLAGVMGLIVVESFIH